MTPEGKIEAYLVKRVKATGGSIRKVRWLCRKGAPDRLAWWTFPRTAFVECKRPGGPLSGHQEREITRLRAAGFKVYVIDSLAGVEHFIEEMVGA